MQTYSGAWNGAVYLQEMPTFYQENGERVNPRVGRYIFDGIPCEYDAEMQNALRKFTGKDNIRNYAVTALLISTAAAVEKAAFEQKKTSAGLIGLAAIICVVLLITVVFFLRSRTNDNAISAAENGNVRCFRYSLNGLFRYETDHIEGDCFYFADLGDFMVRLSSNKTIPAEVCGAVVDINGEEVFYLLV